MKKHLFSVVSTLLLFTIIYGCNDNSTNPEVNITVKPTVKITSTNYDEELFNSSFPQNDILNEISDAYKSSYSNDTKAKIIDYVTERVELLGENKYTFLECFELTGCNNENSISLPTYIEKAIFNGEDSWIIQLAWGFEPSDLGHYKCFAIGIESKDTLYFTRCR